MLPKQPKILPPFFVRCELRRSEQEAVESVAMLAVDQFGVRCVRLQSQTLRASRYRSFEVHFDFRTQAPDVLPQGSRGHGRSALRFSRLAAASVWMRPAAKQVGKRFCRHWCRRSTLPLACGVGAYLKEMS